MVREPGFIDESDRGGGHAASGALVLGFIPLVDCAPLVAAQRKGFARREGLDLTLVRETSWANIRDRVAVGHFDAAHMPAPMPIASSLGLGRPAEPMVAPLSLGLGGNGITLAPDLFAAMAATRVGVTEAFRRFDPMAVAQAFASVLAARRDAGHDRPTLAVVHSFSAQNYELRYWLAAAGIDPDADVRLTVVPPPMMVESIMGHEIHGFCAGEPWNSLAVEAGAGVIAVTKSALWRQGPEKVLGLRTDFADRHPKPTAALVRCIVDAARWASEPGNHAELASILSEPAYLGVPAAIIERALTGHLIRIADAPAAVLPDFLMFHRAAATFPWVSHALWFYAQMVRWRHVVHTPENAARAGRVYRPDLYRAALLSTSADLPRADSKVEGALLRPTPLASRYGTLTLGPDGVFDGRLFDPDRLDEYIASFGIATNISAE